MPSSPLTTTLIQSTVLNAISNILAQLIDQHQNTKPFHLNIPALLQFIIYAIIVVFPNFYWQRYLEARWPGFPRRLSLRWNRPGPWWRWRRRLRFWQPSAATSVVAAAAASPHPGIPLTNIPGAAAENDAVVIVIEDDGADASMGMGMGMSIKDKPVGNTSMGRSSGMGNFAMKFILDQTVGSVVNIVLFLVLISMLKGDGWGRTMEMVHEDFGPIMLARLYYRPLVSGLLFTVVPVDRRVVFGSACGVLWGVYLSLYASV